MEIIDLTDITSFFVDDIVTIQKMAGLLTETTSINGLAKYLTSYT